MPRSVQRNASTPSSARYSGRHPSEYVSSTSIDGRIVGDGTPGEVSAKIHAKFHEIVEGKDPKYDKWLDYVN